MKFEDLKTLLFVNALDRNSKLLTLRNLANVTDPNGKNTSTRAFFAKTERNAKLMPQILGYDKVSISLMLKHGHGNYLKKILPSSYIDGLPALKEKLTEAPSSKSKLPVRHWHMHAFLTILCIFEVDRNTGHIVSEPSELEQLEKVINVFLAAPSLNPLYIKCGLNGSFYPAPEAAIMDVSKAIQNNSSIHYVPLRHLILKGLTEYFPDNKEGILSFAKQSSFSGFEEEKRQFTKLEGILVNAIHNEAVVKDSLEVEHSGGRLTSVKYTIKPEYFDNKGILSNLPGDTQVTYDSQKQKVKITKKVS